jgi:hypothetical protein
MPMIGQRIRRHRAALLIAAFVATTILLLWLAVLEAGHAANEVRVIGPIIHPLPVFPAGPPEPWALPAAIGIFLIALVPVTIWNVRRG